MRSINYLGINCTEITVCIIKYKFKPTNETLVQIVYKMAGFSLSAVVGNRIDTKDNHNSGSGEFFWRSKVKSSS